MRKSKIQKTPFHSLLVRAETPAGKRKKTREGVRRERVTVLVLWFLLVGMGVYTLLFSSWFSIHEIRFQGDSVVSQAQLTNFVTETLQGKRWKLFPNNNLLLLSRKKLGTSLKAKYPKFDGIVLKKKYPHTLVVGVHEKPFAVVWCSGGPCWLLRSDGTTWSARSAEDPIYGDTLLRVIDRSALPVVEGQSMPEIQIILDQYSFFMEEIPKRTNLALASVAETPSRYAHELRLETKEEWIIFLDTTLRSEETLAALVAVVQHGIPEARRAQVLSIDLRVSGRAFVAYRDSQPEEVSLEASLPETDTPIPKTNKTKKDKKE